MEILELKNVEKKFGQFKALDGINLKIKKGEVHGFIGPNGAGKSTTIRTILGMYKATGGSINVLGLDAWKDSVKIHNKVAYVPGDVNLWGNLNGIDVIDLLLSFNGRINKEKRNYYINKFNLDITKKCRSYSKGNRQKVALISAFATDAELLILDEPTSGLDPVMEEVFQGCLREKKEEGKTILLSSHILSEVEKLCDRVSIIRKGKIIESGTLEQLRHITKTNVDVFLDKPIKSIKNLEDVYNIQGNNMGNKLSFQVNTDKIGVVLKNISRYDIKDIKITPPSLESLFEYYYNNEK